VNWCVGLLEWKTVNLRLVEREDLPLLVERCNDPEFTGEFVWVSTLSAIVGAEKMPKLFNMIIPWEIINSPKHYEKYIV
jgi:hypothetical protein